MPAPDLTAVPSVELDLDLTVRHVSEQIEAFAGCMQAEFHLPGDSLDPIYADEACLTEEQADAKRTEQVVSQLQLLGYLGETETDRIEQSTIDAAFDAWERDFEAARDTGALRIHFEEDEATALARAAPELRRIRWLKAVATFEGEVTLLRLPAPGERSLLSRIVHLRLRIYGLLRVRDADTTEPAGTALLKVTDPFDETGAKALRHGGRIFLAVTHADPRSVANLLGHAPAATDAFVAHHEVWPGLYRDPAANGNIPVGRFRVRKFADRPPRWTEMDGRWQRDPGSAGSARLPEFAIAATSLTPAEVKFQEEHPITVVGQQLLQLRLWTFGYYLGALDGAWGPVTAQALEGFARDNPEVFAPEKLRRDAQGRIIPDAYLRWSNDGRAILNLGRLLTVMVDHLDVAAEETSVSDMNRLAEDSVDAIKTEQEWRQVEAKYQALRVGEREKIAAPHLGADGFSSGKTSNAQRKRYFGWRRYFAAAGAFLRRVGGVLVRAVQSVLEALLAGFGQAFEILRYLWRKVRVAMRVARLAGRRLRAWLAGDPVGTRSGTNLCATWISLDFDTLQFVSAGCAAEVAKSHQERLRWMSASLAFMCHLGARVVKACVQLAISALLVAYEIFKAVRALLADEQFSGLFSDEILERGVI